MKKIFYISVLVFSFNLFSQEGRGETIYDDLPETLYVSGIKIQDISAEYMTMNLQRTLGSNLIVRGVGNFYIELDWGQKMLKKPNTKNKFYEQSKSIVTQPVPVESARVFVGTASVALNILSKYGWEPKFVVADIDGSSWILKKKQ